MIPLNAVMPQMNRGGSEVPHSNVKVSPSKSNVYPCTVQMMNQTHLVSLGRIEAVAAEHIAHGVACTDGAQEQRDQRGRVEAQPHLGDGKEGAVGGNDNIGSRNPGNAATDAGALDQGHGWAGEIGQCAYGGGQAGGRQFPRDPHVGLDSVLETDLGHHGEIGGVEIAEGRRLLTHYSSVLFQ